MQKTKLYMPLSLAAAGLIFTLSPASGEASEQETEVTIIHTNDIHSSIEDFGKLAAFLEEKRSESDHVVFLDGGDIFSGDPIVDIPQGAPMVDLLNNVGLDAMVIGNHEFDYGQEAFAVNMENSDFPWLSANTKVVSDEVPFAEPSPYEIIEVNDVSIAVLGITQAPPATAPAGIEGLEFPENYAEVAIEFKYLEDESDIFVGLTHIGHGADQSLAEDVNFFDVIIGGHSHTALSEPATVNGTPVTQAGANLDYIGELTITVDLETSEVTNVNGQLHNIDELEAIDEDIQAMVDTYTEEAEELLGEVIGYTNTGLSRDGRDHGDVPLGNFWTDAMRDSIGTDIAVTNNGGIRDSIAPGDITARDIYTVEPFANEIMEMTMTGEAIKDVIEYSYTRRDNIDLQTSGLEYTILTNSSGSYTDAKLTVDGEPLDPEATYSVAVPDYIGTGGSGYEFAGTVEQEGAGYMTNAMLMYANTLMNTEGAIDYESEGRISIDIEAEAEPGGEEIGNTANGLYSENKTEMDAGLGNLYTDALRSEAEADFAILNNSSVTGEIPPEVITDEQLEGLDQFENTVVVVETTGEQVKEVILEQSNYHGSVDLQVSGLHVQLIEAESGEERFSDVIVTLEDGTELQNNESYLAAYNDYMHGTSFYSLSEHIVTDEIGLVWETVVTFIEAQEEPIDYEEGLRIALNDEAEEEEKVMQTCIINKVHELIPSPPNNEIGYNRGQLTSMLVHYKNGKNVDLPEELSPAKECIDTAK